MLRDAVPGVEREAGLDWGQGVRRVQVSLAVEMLRTFVKMALPSALVVVAVGAVVTVLCLVTITEHLRLNNT